MHVKSSYNVIDLHGNKIFPDKNFTIKQIGVKAKCERNFCGFYFSKDQLDQSFRPDGSWCIVWQVEYFDNVSGLKALPYSENDYQKVEFKHFKI